MQQKQSIFSRPGVIVALVAGVYLLRFWILVPLTILRFLIGIGFERGVLEHLLHMIGL